MSLLPCSIISDVSKEMMLQGSSDIVNAFYATMIVMLSLLACGFAISSALRPQGEEGAGRVESLLATALPRTRWLAGHVVITVRPWREHCELIDLPTDIAGCATAAGLTVVDRAAALLARVTDTGQLVARGSFFQRSFITRQRTAGLPLHLICHEDVLILRRGPHP